MTRYTADDFLSKEAEDALVARAAQRDCTAMTEILDRYKGLIVRSVYHFLGRSSELYQDGHSTAVLALIEAVYDYEASPVSHFAALARSRVRSALVSMLRHEQREWEHTSHPDETSENCDCWEQLSGPDVVDHGPEQFAIEQDLYVRAMQVLTKRERQIADMLYRCDMKEDVICARLQVSAASLSRTKKRLLQKIRDFICNMFDRYSL